MEKLLLTRPLQRPERHRAHVRQDQGLQAHRNTLRQAQAKLPRSRSARRYNLLLVMSPEPRALSPKKELTGVLPISVAGSFHPSEPCSSSLQSRHDLREI